RHTGTAVRTRAASGAPPATWMAVRAERPAGIGLDHPRPLARTRPVRLTGALRLCGIDLFDDRLHRAVRRHAAKNVGVLGAPALHRLEHPGELASDRFGVRAFLVACFEVPACQLPQRL